MAISRLNVFSFIHFDSVSNTMKKSIVLVSVFSSFNRFLCRRSWQTKNASLEINKKKRQKKQQNKTMSQRKPQLIISLHLIRSNYKKIIIYERLWSCTKVIRKRPHHRSTNRQTLRSVNEQPKHKQCCSQDANLEWKLFFPFSTAFLRRNRNKRKCIINHISRASFIRLIEFPSSIFASTKNRDRMLCIAFWKRQIKMIFRNAFDDSF